MPVFGKLIQQVGPEAVEKDMGYYIGQGNRMLQKRDAK